MKLLDWTHLVDVNAFSKSEAFSRVEADIRAAVDKVHWPVESDQFTIRPDRKGNGVKPIKDGFVAYLLSHGWVAEHQTFDCHYTYDPPTVLPFAVEWETGNISSSHRAINRIARGMIEGRISGGVLIVPSRAMYWYLTDRVGNIYELAPYFELWRKWNSIPEFGYLGVITVEHDATDPSVPAISKGTDGRALI